METGSLELRNCCFIKVTIMLNVLQVIIELNGGIDANA